MKYLCEHALFIYLFIFFEKHIPKETAFRKSLEDKINKFYSPLYRILINKHQSENVNYINDVFKY